MPRNHGKLKIRWIVKKALRNVTFRKRRATLLEKVKELSILCKVPAAMVVYHPGDDEPAFWPPELEEAKGIMKKYLELPEASKKMHRLDNEGFLRKALKKMGKRFERYKATSRQLEVNLILNDISLGRRSSLDDLTPELATAVRSEVDLLRRSIHERVNSLTSATAAVVPPPVAVEEAVAPVLVSSQEEPLMVVPVALAPQMVVNVPPLPREPELLLVPPEEPLMAPPQEPLMVPPFAMAPPTAANAPLLVPVPHTLLPVVGDPLAPTAGVGVYNDEDDGFPRDGSYLLEVADAILDDGSGRAVQATEEDVDRLLWEHGLESFIKPKPM